MMEFKAGRALNNRNEWENLVAEVKSLGGYVPQIALQAIKDGAINLYHNSCHNKDPKKVVFRGKKYESLEQLEKADLPNCPSMLQYPDEVDTEMDRLLNIGAIRIMKKVDLEDPDIVISPALWHRKETETETKFRLILHDKRNNCYTKPNFNLKQAFSQLPDLENVSYLCKADQKSCYHGKGGMFEFDSHAYTSMPMVPKSLSSSSSLAIQSHPRHQ